MKKIKDNKIIELLKNEKNIIVTAITPWHANSIEAAFLGSLIKKPIHAIVLCEHVGDNLRIIGQKHFPVIDAYGDVSYYDHKVTEFKDWKEIKSYILLFLKILFKKKGKKNIYIFSTEDLASYWIMNILYNLNDVHIINIVADEGLGTYQKHAINIRTIILKFIKIILSKKITVKYDTLFFKTHNKKIVLNKSILSRYQNVFKANDIKNIKNDLKDIEIETKYIILSLAPIIEMDEISQECLIKILKIIANITQKMNVKVVVKPHPRENKMNIFAEFGWKMIKAKNVSMEVLLANLANKPIALIGSFSTALVTGRLFWDIHAVSILNLADKMEDCSLNNNDIDGFIYIYKKYISFPRNIKEFEVNLKTIFKSKKSQH